LLLKISLSVGSPKITSVILCSYRWIRREGRGYDEGDKYATKQRQCNVGYSRTTLDPVQHQDLPRRPVRCHPLQSRQKTHTCYYTSRPFDRMVDQRSWPVTKAATLYQLAEACQDTHCDPSIIARKHQDSKAVAEPHVRDYVWPGTPLKNQLRVVVSAVWHPRSADCTEFEMSTQYWFLDDDANKADSSTTAYEYRLPF
jgi:hypothetical protein